MFDGSSSRSFAPHPPVGPKPSLRPGVAKSHGLLDCKMRYETMLKLRGYNGYINGDIFMDISWIFHDSRHLQGNQKNNSWKTMLILQCGYTVMASPY